jgi:hypothetical protein
LACTCDAKSELPGPPLSVQWAAEAEPPVAVSAAAAIPAAHSILIENFMTILLFGGRGSTTASGSTPPRPRMGQKVIHITVCQMGEKELWPDGWRSQPNRYP